MSGDVDQTKVGGIGGVYAMVSFTERFGLRLEGLATMKGGKGDVTGTIIDEGNLT
jgi:hypothetical protein